MWGLEMTRIFLSPSTGWVWYGRGIRLSPSQMDGFQPYASCVALRAVSHHSDQEIQEFDLRLRDAIKTETNASCNDRYLTWMPTSVPYRNVTSGLAWPSSLPATYSKKLAGSVALNSA